MCYLRLPSQDPLRKDKMATIVGLTDAKINALKPPLVGQDEYPDSLVPGPARSHARSRGTLTSSEQHN